MFSSLVDLQYDWAPEEDLECDLDYGDSLKYAGTYTDEEAIRIYREKLFKLKSLYMNQFVKLESDLKFERRKYLLTKNRADVTMPVKTYKRFKAYKKYVKVLDKEKVMRSQLVADRKNDSTCHSHAETCHETCLPLTRFCLKHITEDDNQLLYRKCKSDDTCDRVVLRTSPFSACPLHFSVDLFKRKKMQKSFSDEEEDFFTEKDSL